MRTTKEKIIKNFIIIFSFVILTGVMVISEAYVTKASKFYLSNSAITLTKGHKKKLSIVNVPKNKIKKIKWSSSNKFAAKVTKKGKVRALNYGTATIKAVYKKKTYTCTVDIPDTSRRVSLNTTSLYLRENTTYQLVATAASPVTYHSSNESILTVDAKGKVTAINPGIAFVTAKTKTGYARCSITVASSDIARPSAGWQMNRSIAGIRRLTKKDNAVYDYISWAKGKTISFVVSGLDADNIKKCVWSSSDKTILSNLTAQTNKLKASAQTLKAGTVTVSARVTDKKGNTKTYTNQVYVSEPAVNTKNIILLGPSVGSNRQQFISFCGLTSYSKIEWSNSNDSIVTLSPYNKKAALWGIRNGTGTVTASVDGKTFKINYTVINPIFSGIKAVVAQNKTTKLTVTGAQGATPVFSSRDTGIAVVASDGTIKGVKSGVTYIDMRIAQMTFSYRVEVAAKGMKKIIKRAQYIVNNWTYSQAKRMKKGYYDCSALVWKGYKKYKNYHTKLGSGSRALPSGDLFDYLYGKNQIVYFGYTSTEDLKPGDLIFYGDYNNAVIYSTPGRTLNIYHVSMYAGNGKVVEKGGQTINYNNTRHIVGIGRVVN